jgi:hypothetical protein
MEKTAIEWVDKIFNLMAEFYGERWTTIFNGACPESAYKLMWQSALTGCTYDEIRNVLIFLRRASKNPFARPPHHMEFFRYAKGKSIPFIDYSVRAKAPADIAIARNTLDEINAKLHFRKKVERVGHQMAAMR